MYPILSGFIMEFAVLKALGRIGTGETVGALLGAPLMLVPGLAISAWRLRRHRRRFDRSMVAKGFFAMRRELSQARSVQMALFPAAIHRPDLDFDYAYQPANEVGGDFIHASIDAKGRLDVVLMDVTGHGLASALTVARLSGEIERLLAEDPDIAPGAVLRALNRYVLLTLSKHSVYLTALAIQVDPVHGTVRYVNAGHPPAWVRRGDGSIDRFDSTTFLLGVMPDDEFDAEEREIALGPADTLVLVTDGVHEAPDRAGRQFGLDRIGDTLARLPAGGRVAQLLSTAVEQWRGKVGDDDVLVATVRVPQAVPIAPGALDRAAEIEAHVTLGEPAGAGA
jgi:serine phosphatase RsbU (regulator of sigma subunit)